jgi:hypothetical protein
MLHRWLLRSAPTPVEGGGETLPVAATVRARADVAATVAASRAVGAVVRARAGAAATVRAVARVTAVVRSTVSIAARVAT